MLECLGTLAHQLLEAFPLVAGVQLLAAAMQGAGDLNEDIVGVKGFADVSIGALFEGHGRVWRAIGTADHDDGGGTLHAPAGVQGRAGPMARGRRSAHPLADCLERATWRRLLVGP